MDPAAAESRRVCVDVYSSKWSVCPQAVDLLSDPHFLMGFNAELSD